MIMSCFPFWNTSNGIKSKRYYLSNILIFYYFQVVYILNVCFLCLIKVFVFILEIFFVNNYVSKAFSSVWRFNLAFCWRRVKDGILHSWKQNRNRICFSIENTLVWHRMTYCDWTIFYIIHALIVFQRSILHTKKEKAWRMGTCWNCIPIVSAYMKLGPAFKRKVTRPS